jgi:2-haloacid dehalogenase
VSSPSQRWATFDCYGTLVDWNAGIGAELARLLGDEDVDGRLESYHHTERRIQREQPTARYRDVMALALAELASQAGAELPADERDALGRSLPDWPVFPDVRDALTEANERGWTLVVLSNTDRDLIDASLGEIGVPFDRAIVASEVGSYKPAHGHWHAFYESTGADGHRHVHVAQSHFHDIAPADQLGIPSVWINRRGEQHEPPPTRELSNLTGLADTLDELVPPS